MKATWRELTIRPRGKSWHAFGGERLCALSAFVNGEDVSSWDISLRGAEVDADAIYWGDSGIKATTELGETRLGGRQEAEPVFKPMFKDHHNQGDAYVCGKMRAAYDPAGSPSLPWQTFRNGSAQQRRDSLLAALFYLHSYYHGLEWELVEG